MTYVEIIKTVESTKFTSDDLVTVTLYNKDNTTKSDRFWGYDVSVEDFVEDNKDYKIYFGCFMNHGHYRTPCRVEIYEQ